MPLPLIHHPTATDRSPAEGPSEATPARVHRRFDRAARLFSEPGYRRLADARVLVIGVGGVGSFAAESLVRSGVGALALVDFDEICVTNANRQLHTLRGQIGKKKVEVMAERLRQINPVARIEPWVRFYNPDSSDEVLSGSVDYVIDAIDNLSAKAHLVASCLHRALPLVSSMGAAARLDPTRIRVADLNETHRDPFARALRKILRREYRLGLEPSRPMGVPAVYSEETPRPPSALSYDDGEGFRCVCPQRENNLHTCDRRRRIDGSAAFVTGAFGLAAASVVVRDLIGQ